MDDARIRNPKTEADHYAAERFDASAPARFDRGDARRNRELLVTIRHTPAARRYDASNLVEPTHASAEPNRGGPTAAL